MKAQVGGNVLVRAAAMGEQNNVQAVPEFAVVRGAKRQFEPLDLGLGQLDADRGCFLLLGSVSPPS
ncbi:MAG TPA: hypothetical protein VKE49_02025, partial [Myxococcaceae bacterium]|nr:hypothetical protein [Myxococcaceae bacterium]